MSFSIATMTAQDLQPLERATYSFTELAGQVERQEEGERLVSEREINTRGIMCRPFWDTPGDWEGEYYRAYRTIHPGFGLSIRATVLDMLVEAQRTLPKNWSIVLKAGWRPMEVQNQLLESLMTQATANHPDWSQEQTLAYAETYVMNPSVVCPPHVTGGAIDIDIWDGDLQQSVDMGCPPNTDGEIAHHGYAQLSLEQQHNRQTLLEAMLAVGFAPLASEWWHYQYGESYWAAFYGHETTKYDVITL